MERRLVVEQFDPELAQPGGIDTCIRGLVEYCPPGIQLRIAGVDAVGNKKLGEWTECSIGGRTVEFMPIARLDHSDLRRRVPHSVRVALGLKKYRPALDSDVVQTHRINTGAVAINLYRSAEHVQFLHSSGVWDLAESSESFFNHAVPVYRSLERYVIPRSADVVVFSEAGAKRLQATSPRVRFSTTWYDPKVFFPNSPKARVKSRILWAGRMEQGKNPHLALAVMDLIAPRFSLTLAGSGTLEPDIRELAENSPAKESITVLGRVEKAKMGELMRQHDLMLMTSRYEGYPRVIVEGLASGLPVVTTSTGEPNGLVETGFNGARVESDKPEDFPCAIELAADADTSAVLESVHDLSALVVVPRVLATVT